jgi:hypothetical protein
MAILESGVTSMNQSVREFLDTYNNQKDITIDIGGYIRNSFTEYPLQSAIFLASIIAFVYLIASGMTIVAFGQIILIYLGMYIYNNLLTTSKKSWPPIFSVCPNGYYQVPNTSGTATIMCKKLTNDSVVFTYTGSVYNEGCAEARRLGIDWDVCS